MLLITCPNCGVAADETELHAGREAHITCFEPDALAPTTQNNPSITEPMSCDMRSMTYVNGTLAPERRDTWLRKAETPGWHSLSAHWSSWWASLPIFTSAAKRRMMRISRSICQPLTADETWGWLSDAAAPLVAKHANSASSGA